MSMPLDFITMVWAITEIPGEVVPSFGIANLEFLAIGSSGRFKVFDEQRQILWSFVVQRQICLLS
jgi:hypothetical protein